MDRLAQTALSALRQMQDNKFDLAHNLANVNVPGFRRDLPNEGNAGFLKELEKLSAKVLPLETEARKFSNEAGQLQNTGLETDVAVLNQGFFYIQPENGEIALSRRGDLGLNAENQLVNGVGDLVLSDGLEPIILPNFTSMSITDIGEVLVQQAGAPDGQLTSVGFIGSTSSEIDQLVKSLDGNIRKADGTVPAADQTARFGQGFLESSNVSAIEELIRNIDMQRQFEINVKLIKKASDLDSAGAKLMNLPT
jgi:flagellar basal-body rod protein FlgF|tara:strand:+ start:283 stop:1038 length:756 start_codon:yes stop_codon:yes gene_type:complete